MEMESKTSMIVCPGCTSLLLYPVAIERHPDGRRIVIERYCPECEHNDSVCCGVTAAERWVRRERRIRLQLVRQVVDLELDDILGVPAVG
jgi:hypothetical protein